MERIVKMIALSSIPQEYRYMVKDLHKDFDDKWIIILADGYYTAEGLNHIVGKTKKDCFKELANNVTTNKRSKL